MDKYTRWYERARHSYDTADVFSSTPDAKQLIAQAFFGTCTKRIGSMGMYLELYEKNPGKEISAYILSYSAPYDDVSQSVKAEKVEINITNEPFSIIEMATSPLDQGNIYTIYSVLELKTDANLKTKLSNASAELNKDYQQAKEYRCFDLKISPVVWPNRSRNIRVSGRLFGKFVANAKALCPNCLGNGSFATMKIPKADWESGATGYHLYACNQLNGREACDVCSGSGGKYFRWYIKENPQLRNVKFIPGSGIQKYTSNPF
jgi:hypothetical protein